MCGEKTGAIEKPSSGMGSPPRVRGKVKLLFLAVNPLRITPACAGKRERVIIWQCFAWDHPRVCGEKHCGGACEWRHVGSPPRVRGKANYEIGRNISDGITPACAGKSCRRSRRRPSSRDHPRVCGEKSRGWQDMMHILGSPPRVRGKDGTVYHTLPWTGITPACAGKSGHPHHLRRGNQDHPRVCGEKSWVRPSFSSVTGSPPRVRGKGNSGQFPS